MEITLKDLPKVSLNSWYSGIHWSKRKAIKDDYKLIIKSQFKHVLSKKKKYNVEYKFRFRIRPLDASNCAAMIKMIEDIIFEDDRWDIIWNMKVSSRKSDSDVVYININEAE